MNYRGLAPIDVRWSPPNEDFRRRYFLNHAFQNLPDAMGVPFALVPMLLGRTVDRPQGTESDYAYALVAIDPNSGMDEAYKACRFVGMTQGYADHLQAIMEAADDWTEDTSPLHRRALKKATRDFKHWMAEQVLKLARQS